MIVEESYEYVPPGGDASLPILIHGFAPFVPGKRRIIESFMFRVPDAASYSLQDRLVVPTWPEVVSRLLECFPDETANGLTDRMKPIVPVGSPMP